MNTGRRRPPTMPTSSPDPDEPAPRDVGFARLAALTDADPDATLDASARDAAAVDAGGDAALDERIAEQERLRGACARAMDGPEHRCPDELRARLTAATAEPARAAEPPPAPQVAGRIGPRRWVGALAAAALIAVSTVAVVGTLRTLRPGPTPTGVAGVVQVLNDGQAAAFDGRHRVCGSDPTTLFQTERFPETLDGLDARLTDVIDASLGLARLDLSSLGFRYRGAGHCNVPGPGAVHVVYRNDTGQALSLWLRPDDGGLNLEPGRLYGPPADGPQAGRILVWRDGDVVLYLVGDLPGDVERAQPQLALHPA